MGDLARLIRRDKCNHMSSYKKEAEGDSVHTERRGSEDGAERDWEAPALKTGAVATRQGLPAASDCGIQGTESGEHAALLTPGFRPSDTDFGPLASRLRINTCCFKHQVCGH